LRGVVRKHKNFVRHRQIYGGWFLFHPPEIGRQANSTEVGAAGLFLFVDLKENNNAKSNNEALFFLPLLDPCGDEQNKQLGDL